MISWQKVVTGDKETRVLEHSPIEEYKGKLRINIEKGLMRSVLENDREVIEHGRLIADSVNQGINSFTPSLIFDQLVKNYSLAKSILGESIIRAMTGYEPGLVEKNIKLPEFQRELLSRIQEKFEKLKDEKLIDKEGSVTEKGIDLASLILYTEELDNLTPKGITGERLHKHEHPYGMKDEIRAFRKDKYRDISLRKSIKKAIARGHEELMIEDLVSQKRKSRGQRFIIYGMDASGSMKGEKLEQSKKAGIALAFKAISGKDLAGLIVFGTSIKSSVPPTDDFTQLLKEMTRIKASAQTNISQTILESIKLFPKAKGAKHLILLTDALPTKGEKPEQESISAASSASASGITISLVGIKLDRKGTEIAQKIVEAGKGRLYIAKDLKEIDKLVLMDYYST